MNAVAGSRPLDSLLSAFTSQSPAALARAVSIVENRRASYESILTHFHGSLGRARRIGITGPPGAGKSTITTALTERFRAAKLTVGIIAVDPTSPFTGGALLGDRIRMERIALDSGVFIRSMATRGSLGGLATATRDVADVLDAYGFDRILIETVGVGQTELDIARAADTSLVVLVPESGDSIQTLKAGLMEIADVFAVNKADRPGADRLAHELGVMLGLRHGDGPERDWPPPVLRTTASTGDGIDELLAALDRHFQYLERSGVRLQRSRARLRERVVEAVEQQLHARLWNDAALTTWLDDRLSGADALSLDPFDIARDLLLRAGATWRAPDTDTKSNAGG